MMFRPFLLICALFACLGVSSACLTTKEWMSILPEGSEKQDNLWEKAKVRASMFWVRFFRFGRLLTPAHP